MLPVVVKVTGIILVTEPEALFTLAVKIPVVGSKFKPVPKIISPGVPAVVAFLLPNKVLAPMAWILL